MYILFSEALLPVSWHQKQHTKAGACGFTVLELGAVVEAQILHPGRSGVLGGRGYAALGPICLVSK